MSLCSCGTGKFPVNDEYKKSADAKVILDNLNCHFVPHVIGVHVGQTLELKNSDPVAHNSNIQGNLLKFNPLLPAHSSTDTAVSAPESLPVIVTCNIHDWMKGWIVVRPDPYFAISDASGNFELKNLPAGGDLELQAWHENGRRTGRQPRRFEMDRKRPLSSELEKRRGFGSQGPARHRRRAQTLTGL